MCGKIGEILSKEARKVASPKNPALMYKAGSSIFLIPYDHPTLAAPPPSPSCTPEPWRQTPPEAEVLASKAVNRPENENAFLSLCRLLP